MSYQRNSSNNQLPPSYNSIFDKVLPQNSLKPLAVFVSFVGLLYCIFRGSTFLKDSVIGDIDSATSSIKAADISFGVIYICLGLFELGGVIVALQVGLFTIVELEFISKYHFRDRQS